MINSRCSVLREIGLSKAVADIVLRIGTSAQTSTQANQVGQVIGRTRSKGEGSAGFIGGELLCGHMRAGRASVTCPSVTSVIPDIVGHATECAVPTCPDL